MSDIRHYIGAPFLSGWEGLATEIQVGPFPSQRAAITAINDEIWARTTSKFLRTSIVDSGALATLRSNDNKSWREIPTRVAGEDKLVTSYVFGVPVVRAVAELMDLFHTNLPEARTKISSSKPQRFTASHSGTPNPVGLNRKILWGLINNALLGLKTCYATPDHPNGAGVTRGACGLGLVTNSADFVYDEESSSETTDDDGNYTYVSVMNKKVYRIKNKTHESHNVNRYRKSSPGNIDKSWFEVASVGYQEGYVETFTRGKSDGKYDRTETTTEYIRTYEPKTTEYGGKIEFIVDLGYTPGTGSQIFDRIPGGVHPWVGETIKTHVGVLELLTAKYSPKALEEENKSGEGGEGETSDEERTEYYAAAKFFEITLTLDKTYKPQGTQQAKETTTTGSSKSTEVQVDAIVRDDNAYNRTCFAGVFDVSNMLGFSNSVYKDSTFLNIKDQEWKVTEISDEDGNETTEGEDPGVKKISGSIHQSIFMAPYGIQFTVSPR